jgi:2-succinyl-5-enolpyruvyl-6-hydroxy-3-cyclohexene-1-carboxylate synthase
MTKSTGKVAKHQRSQKFKRTTKP